MAGFYEYKGNCYRCEGNLIKRSAGNSPNCDKDEPCDGELTVPNEYHTDCGAYTEQLNCCILPSFTNMNTDV